MTVLPRTPLHVVMILGTRCNLSCVHCSSSAGEPGPDELRPVEIEGILVELAEAGVVDVALSGGEPLLRKDLETIIARARGLGMQVGTSTNGYALTPERAYRLREAGLSRLQISLDGTAAMHDSIRGAGAHAVAISAIRTSAAAGLRTHACFTSMRRNYRHFTQVVADAAAAGAQGVNLSQFVATGRGPTAEDLTPDEANELLRAWSAVRAAHPELSLPVHLSGVAEHAPDLAAAPGFIGCHAGIYIACVTARGDVTPCVMLPLALGNLRERRFVDIWTTHPAIASLRRRALTGTCGSCRWTQQCGGCRAAAWARTGDLLADDHRCRYVTPERQIQELPCHTSSSTHPA